MSSHQPDRCIPHVRDIFGDYNSYGDDIVFSKFSCFRVSEKTGDDLKNKDGFRNNNQECSDEEHYEYRGYSSDEASKSSNHSDTGMGHHQHSSNNNKKNSVRRNDNWSNNDNYDNNKKADNLNKYSNNYKTLTEKDLKHIERHLSMKKTIRKQISRHLSQAFVENLDPYGDNANAASAAPEKKNTTATPHPNYSNITLSRSSKSAAKSEPNFLDMLKKNESSEHHRDHGASDSGHSSPSASRDQDRMRRSGMMSSASSSSSPRKQYVPEQQQQVVVNSEQQKQKKSSFWQKLTKRNKSGR